MEYSPAAGGQFTKYYYVGSQRLAMKTSSGTLHFFANDHLGSTSLTLNSNGSVFSELRYKPFGETRWSQATTPTQRRFTGQIQDFDLVNMQLYFYNARYYDPELARFTQADTIVPSMGNPQSWNRYSYVYNNPINYIDPTGHDPLDEEWRKAFIAEHGREPDWLDELIRLYSLAYMDEWFSLGLANVFYNSDGTYNYAEVERQLKFEIPENRTWDTLGDALISLGSFYEDNEEHLFIQDIGLLFAGLPSRSESQLLYYTTDGRLGVHLRSGSLDSKYYVDPNGQQDGDANVHHWAWSLTLGYNETFIGPMVNTMREYLDPRQTAPYNGRVNEADVQIGNAGAMMGRALRYNQGISDIPTLLKTFLGIGN